MSDFSKICQDLGIRQPTAEQLQICNYPTHLPTDEASKQKVGIPLLVVAAAGSGKTETISLRSLSLMHRLQIRPSDILGLTFTKKATQELSSRLNLRLGKYLQLVTNSKKSGENALFVDRASVFTYNGFALQIVQEYGYLLGLEDNFTHCSEVTSYQLMRDIVSNSSNEFFGDWTLDTVVGQALDLRDAISNQAIEHEALTQALHELNGTLAQIKNPRGQVAAGAKSAIQANQQRLSLLPLIETFEEQKQTMGLVDYTDQLNFALKIVENNPKVVEEIRLRYPIVFLDEFQDTSMIQMRLLSSLFYNHPVTAVGDPCQAIYGWRGASAASVDLFHSYFSKDDSLARQVLSLSIAWRNSKKILEVANRVSLPLRITSRPYLDSDTQKKLEKVPIKDLEAKKGAGEGRVKARYFPSSKEEFQYIADYILELKRANPTVSVAVLCRRKGLFSSLLKILEENDINTQVIGLDSLLIQPVIRDLICILQVLSHSGKSVYLFRLLTNLNLGLNDMVALYHWAKDLVIEKSEQDSTKERDEEGQDFVKQNLTNTYNNENNSNKFSSLYENIPDLSYKLKNIADDEKKLNDEETPTSGKTTKENPAGVKNEIDENSLVWNDFLTNIYQEPIIILEAIYETLGNKAKEKALRYNLTQVGLERIQILASKLQILSKIRRVDLVQQIRQVRRIFDLDAIGVFTSDSGVSQALDVFENFAYEMQENSPLISMADFLDYLELARSKDGQIVLPSLPLDQTAVHLMTVHAAKGLEYDCIIVPDLSEGHFPHHRGKVKDFNDLGAVAQSGWLNRPGEIPYPYRSDQKYLPTLAGFLDDSLTVTNRMKSFQEDVGSYLLDEERTIAYVAITRARSNLLLCGSWYSGEQTTPRLPSVFLRELLLSGILAGDLLEFNEPPVDYTPEENYFTYPPQPSELAKRIETSSRLVNRICEDLRKLTDFTLSARFKIQEKSGDTRANVINKQIDSTSNDNKTNPIPNDTLSVSHKLSEETGMEYSYETNSDDVGKEAKVILDALMDYLNSTGVEFLATLAPEAATTDDLVEDSCALPTQMKAEDLFARLSITKENFLTALVQYLANTNAKPRRDLDFLKQVSVSFLSKADNTRQWIKDMIRPIPTEPQEIMSLGTLVHQYIEEALRKEIATHDDSAGSYMIRNFSLLDDDVDEVWQDLDEDQGIDIEEDFVTAQPEFPKDNRTKNDLKNQKEKNNFEDFFLKRCKENFAKVSFLNYAKPLALEWSFGLDLQDLLVRGRIDAVFSVPFTTIEQVSLRDLSTDESLDDWDYQNNSETDVDNPAICALPEFTWSGNCFSNNSKINSLELTKAKKSANPRLDKSILDRLPSYPKIEHSEIIVKESKGKENNAQEIGQDKIYNEETGVYLLVDWKTGSGKNIEANRAVSYLTQLELYCKAWSKKNQINPNLVEATLVFLSGKVPRYLSLNHLRRWYKENFTKEFNLDEVPYLKLIAKK